MPEPNISNELSDLIKLVESEFSAPGFTHLQITGKMYDEARYFFVYFAHVVLNIPFVELRNVMTCYTYNKTIYQVFKRAYYRRKQFDGIATVEAFKRLLAVSKWFYYKFWFLFWILLN